MVFNCVVYRKLLFSIFVFEYRMSYYYLIITICHTRLDDYTWEKKSFDLNELARVPFALCPNTR